MKKDNVKQHFVPQGYLKRFAEKNKNNKDHYHTGVIRYEDDKVKFFIKAIDDVGYEKNMYDTLSKEDPKYWEHYFSEYVEPRFGEYLNGLLSRVVMVVDKKPVLTVDDKVLLSGLICVQLMRVPAFLYRHIERSKRIANVYWDRITRIIEDRLSQEQVDQLKQYTYSDDFIKDTIITHVTNDKNISVMTRILLERAWVLFYNQSDMPFFTSDNPVVMYNTVSESTDYYDNGIARHDTIIFFPLSTETLLVLYPIDYLSGAMKKYDSHRITLSNRDWEFLLAVNGFQKTHAHHEIYVEPSFFYELTEGKESGFW